MKIVFLLWLGSAFLRPASSTVGFQKVSVPDPSGKTFSAAVWFPSVGKPVSVSVGPFQQMVVPDGAVSGTRLPMVLISHGTAGSEGSHYDTAMALAADGFVVVALTHTGDNYRTEPCGESKELTDRPRQVSAVLSACRSLLGPARSSERGARWDVRILVRRLHDLGGDRRYSGREPDARAVHETPNRSGMPLHKGTERRSIKPGGPHTTLDPRSAGESSSSGGARSQLLIWAWIAKGCEHSDPVVASR